MAVVSDGLMDAALVGLTLAVSLYTEQQKMCYVHVHVYICTQGIMRT